MKFRNTVLKSALAVTLAAATVISIATRVNAEAKRVEIPGGKGIPGAVLDVSCVQSGGETIVVVTMTPNDLETVSIGSASMTVFSTAAPLSVSRSSTPPGQPSRLIGLYVGYINQVLVRGSFSATAVVDGETRFINYPISDISVGCSLSR